MDKVQIQQLLTKYFEGNTTLEEERFLQEYFAAGAGIDEDLHSMKKHFELFRIGSRLSFDTVAIESGILKCIESYEHEMHPPVRQINLTKLLIAASIALVITFSGIFFLKNKNSSLHDTYSDPQLAYQETQKALLYVSQKMNKGLDPLSKISKINTGTSQLKKLEKMDESLGMLNLVSIINQSSNLKK